MPRQEYSIQFQFNSSPENVEKLTKSVFALIDSLKTQGPSAARRRQGEGGARRGRARWRSSRTATGSANIMARDQAGEDIAGCSAPYDAMVKALTPAQIQDAAKKYFDMTQLRAVRSAAREKTT